MGTVVDAPPAMRLTIARVLVVLAVALSRTLYAQRPDDRAPRFTAGVTAGTLRFDDARTDHVINATLQLQPVPWLTLSASPGVGRTTYAGESRSGLADLPLSATATYDGFADPRLTVLWGSLFTALPTSDYGSPLSVGGAGVGVGLGVGMQPREGTFTYVSGSRPVTSGTGNGWLEVEGAKWVGPVTATLTMSSEVGALDSAATPSRSVAGGIIARVSGPVLLNVDASRGLTAGAPRWSLSIGVGTAIGGLSRMRVDPTVGRLSKVFGPKAAARSGYTKPTGGKTTCQKGRTC